MNGEYPNITEDGKLIFPKLDKSGKYTGAYVPYNNTILLENIALDNRGVFKHETNHVIQYFFGSNYFQLGEKGYNDKLVDVGRWFTLNNYYIPEPSKSKYYPYNLRELDSMEIVSPVDKKLGGLFDKIDKKEQEKYKNERNK